MPRGAGNVTPGAKHCTLRASRLGHDRGSTYCVTQKLEVGVLVRGYHHQRLGPPLAELLGLPLPPLLFTSESLIKVCSLPLVLQPLLPLLPFSARLTVKYCARYVVSAGFCGERM